MARDASEDRNESWPVQSLELLRMLNALELPSRNELADKIRKLSAGFPLAQDEGLLTREIQRYLLDRYAERNGLLAERYWTREEKRPFDEQEVKSYDKPYSGLTAENYAAIIADLWSERRGPARQS